MKVEFENSKGMKLAGVLEKPECNGPFPAVVICHGFTGVKEEGLHEILAKTLVENGFMTLRFDFTGNGASEGEFSDGTVEQETKDLKCAVDFVKQNDVGDVFVTGHSMGAIVVFNYCSQYEIKACAVIAPGVLFRPYADKRFSKYMDELKEHGSFTFHKDHYDGRNRDYKITNTFLDSFKSIDVFELGSKMAVPIMVVQGSNDSNVASKTEAIKKLCDLIKGPKEIKWVKDADHCFYKPEHAQEMSEAVAEFFKRQE